VLWGVLRWSEHTLALVGLLCVVYFSCFDLSMIVSPSMSPTLTGNERQGDWVLTERVSYRFRQPRRWEIVRFPNVDGYTVMKRVVGLPGESVAVHDGRPLIDGQRVPLPKRLDFLHYYAFGNLSQGRAFADGAGYFVMGDDSKDSQDSRFDWPVKPETIAGRAWMILWPLNRFGFVTP
jgi:signal peptidase I